MLIKFLFQHYENVKEDQTTLILSHLSVTREVHYIKIAQWLPVHKCYFVINSLILTCMSFKVDVCDFIQL